MIKILILSFYMYTARPASPKMESLSKNGTEIRNSAAAMVEIANATQRVFLELSQSAAYQVDEPTAPTKHMEESVGSFWSWALRAFPEGRLQPIDMERSGAMSQRVFDFVIDA